MLLSWPLAMSASWSLSLEALGDPCPAAWGAIITGGSPCRNMRLQLLQSKVHARRRLPEVGAWGSTSPVELPEVISAGDQPSRVLSPTGVDTSYSRGRSQTPSTRQVWDNLSPLHPLLDP